jgi:outer membrane protein OmpA-like peptidoglycan-associated protein
MSTVSFAQKQKYSTTNRGAIKSFDDGTAFFDNRQYDAAIRSFETAIMKDPNFIEAYILIAEVYASDRLYAEAIESYKKGIAINPEFYPNNLYQLGSLQFNTGKYEDAISSLESFTKYAKQVGPEKQLQVEQLVRNSKYALEAIKAPVEFTPINLGNGINSKFSEYYPTFTVDQQEIIFTRDIADANAMGGHQEDFYLSKLRDSIWQQSINAGGPLNSSLNEGAPSISADGRILFFTACDRPDGKGSCDIYITQRMNDGSWTKPLNIGAPINTGAWETQPSFSSDGKTLYFIRGTINREGGRQQDIWVTSFQKDMTWSEPQQLSSKINTKGNEESVFIHPDNQSLYFSSNGHAGMGGLDIFLSRKQLDGSWGDPINLGYPINTYNDENSLVVSADGKRAYFASDRKGGFGGLDLYSFSLYKMVQPLLVSYVKARVIDAATKEPLSSQFEIIDVESGAIIISNSTDKKRGEFMACLPSGKNYMLNVNKEGYLFYSDYFECKTSNERQNAFELLVPLKKPVAGEKVVLKNVFFDVNKADLKNESTYELQKLVSFLKANTTVKIEIGGHTDNTGDKKANLLLSQNRANSVKTFLTSKGIAASQLVSKGYGDTVPVASNDNDIGRSQNRRTEFVIL